MLSLDLKHLKTKAHSYLLEIDRPQPTHLIARHLFGPRRHEYPEAHVVVRTLLADDPRFIETHEGRWSARDASHLRSLLRDTTFAVVDLETTGSLIGVDEIIEIGVVVLQCGHVKERFSSLVQTDRQVPRWVENLTGIHACDLVDAPNFSDLSASLAGLLQNSVFVAHDIRFDLPFLRWAFASHDLPMPNTIGLCTLRLSRQLWPELESRTLVDLARHFGVPHNNPHRADADADATAGILCEALDCAQRTGLREVGDLFQLAEAGSGTGFPAAFPLAARAAE